MGQDGGIVRYFWEGEDGRSVWALLCWGRVSGHPALVTVPSICCSVFVSLLSSMDFRKNKCSCLCLTISKYVWMSFRLYICLESRLCPPPEMVLCPSVCVPVQRIMFLSHSARLALALTLLSWQIMSLLLADNLNISTADDGFGSLLSCMIYWVNIYHTLPSVYAFDLTWSWGWDSAGTLWCLLLTRCVLQFSKYCDTIFRFLCAIFSLAWFTPFWNSF